VIKTVAFFYKLFSHETTNTKKILHMDIVKETLKDSFVSGEAFNNFDQDKLTGISTVLRSDAQIPVEAIQNDSFRYLGVVKIDADDNRHVTLNDEYFMSRFPALQEAIPQFAPNYPPSHAYRSRKNDFDTRIMETELGQEDGRVGVYKQIEENGEDVSYYLVAVAGAELACSELKELIANKGNAIENWGNSNTDTIGDFMISSEYGFTRDLARTNVKRILYDASAALEVIIPKIQYCSINLNSNKQSFPYMADTKVQSINTMSNAQNSGDLVITREVVPFSQINSNTPIYVLEGPSDAIYHFDSGRTHLAKGFPVTTGRHVSLPASAKEISSKITEDYKKRSQRFAYEEPATIAAHPDLFPGTFKKVRSKNDRSFLESLNEIGWDEKNFYDKLTPVCVKISNPYYTRQQKVAVNTGGNTDDVDDY